MNGDTPAWGDHGRLDDPDADRPRSPDGARRHPAGVEGLDARRSAAWQKAGRDPAALARRWREAAARLEAACRRVGEAETEATVAQQDAADAEASEALGALAGISGSDPRLLAAHADALEWLMDEFGVLSEDRHYAALGRAIVAELRLLAGAAPGTVSVGPAPPPVARATRSG